MSTSNNSTSNKKAKTRHVIKFRDWEIDEEDFDTLTDLTHGRTKAGHEPKNPKFLIDQRYVKLGDTPKGDRRVTEVHSRWPKVSLYFDGILRYIQQFDALECLSLEDTLLDNLPESLDRLHSLKELSLRRCRSLTRTPTVLDNMTFLQVLDLRGCTNLQKLSDGIGKMDGLQILRLSMTYLVDLPNTIGYLTNLKELHLEGTHETEKGPLTPFLSKLHNLESLHVTSCTLSRFPSDFVTECSKIKTLRLEWTHDDGSDNEKASSTIQKIRRMDSLESAHIYGFESNISNQLPENSISSAFGQLNNLKKLQLFQVVVYLVDLDGQHSLENLFLYDCIVKISADDADTDICTCTLGSLRILCMIDCHCQFDLSSLQSSTLENLHILHYRYGVDSESDTNNPVKIHRLEHFPNLKEVDIRDLEVNAAAFIELESLSKFTKVEQLKLKGVLPWRGEGGERMIIFPFLRCFKIDFDKRHLPTDCSIASLLRRIEFPVLQSFSIHGSGDNGDEKMSSGDFEKICSELLSTCSHLEQASFRFNQISSISEAAISSLPKTLKVLDLWHNPVVGNKKPSESFIEMLSKILDRCPQLGYIGFAGGSTDPSGKIGHKMSMNRARSRVLGSQKIPTALWPQILSNAPVAFKPYKEMNGSSSYNPEWNEKNGFQGIKDPTDGIFHLLRQRAARDLFYPLE